MFRRFARRGLIPMISSVTVAIACSDNIGGPIDPEAEALLVIEGEDQTGLAGRRLDSPIVLETAAPFSGPFEVTMKVTLESDGYIAHGDEWAAGAGGSIVIPHVTTAAVEWTLSRSHGANRLRAIAYRPDVRNADTLEVIVRARAIADSLTRRVVQLGNNQVADAGTLLPQPVTVELVDMFGNPFFEYVVRWSVIDGEGSLSADSTMTDFFGRATVEWTLGVTGGQQHIVASIEGIGNVAFTAVAQ